MAARAAAAAGLLIAVGSMFDDQKTWVEIRRRLEQIEGERLNGFRAPDEGIRSAPVPTYLWKVDHSAATIWLDRDQIYACVVPLGDGIWDDGYGSKFRPVPLEGSFPGHYRIVDPPARPVP